MRTLGPESPFSNNAKPGEGEQFVLDAFDYANEGRFEIDPFSFRRYVVLGWICEIEAFPYYELTPSGETTYWKFFRKVAPKPRPVSWEEDWGDDDDD